MHQEEAVSLELAREALRLGERLGSGDGEGEASMTRQMPYEPLPASVLFALGCGVLAAHSGAAEVS